jgi:DNA polymerase III subunit beta
MFFEAGGRVLMARMIDVNFPNYMEVISRDNDRVSGRSRAAALDDPARLAGGQRADARDPLRFRSRQAHRLLDQSELGDARETVPIEYSGQPFHVGLNAAYVSDFLAAVETPNVSLDLKDENSQCIGRPLGRRDLPYDYLYVVMPMRIS